MAQRDARDSESVWYRLGYTLESAARPRLGSRLRSLAERRSSSGNPGDGNPGDGGSGDDGGGDPANDAGESGRRPARTDGKQVAKNDDDGGGAVGSLVAAGAGAVAARILGLWPARRKPGFLGLVRAGLAGAGAAFLHQILRLVLDGRRPGLDRELADALAAGAARGLVYASVVEPRLAGSPAVRGVLYGAVEYAVSPWGGLPRLLGRAAPHRRVPLLSGLYEGYDPADDTFVEHVAFAVALALLYGVEDGDIVLDDG